MKQKIIIANLIDWSESFVDQNGSFYCGTTDEEKENAARLVGLADLVIESTDLHPITAPEFNINGGLYPAHSVFTPERYGRDFVYSVGPNGESLRLLDRTMSPRLTKKIADAILARRTGIIIPKEICLQDESVSLQDIENTFGFKVIGADDFMVGDYTRVIAPKKYFDATRLDSDISLSTSRRDLPLVNYNVFSLLKSKFPGSEYELIFVNTGVVEGICRLHTSTGLRQMFPEDRVINVSDATTPLFGINLGYNTAQESRDACMRVGRDIGIEYKTTEEIVKELKK